MSVNNCRLENIEATIDAARKLCIDRQCKDATGHNHHHSFRVHDTALALQAVEGGNIHVIRTAALLHDINDIKLLTTGIEPIDLIEFLINHGLTIEKAEHIDAVINRISFKGANVAHNAPDIETAVVMDADRLDAIGASDICLCLNFWNAFRLNGKEQCEIQ